MASPVASAITGSPRRLYLSEISNGSDDKGHQNVDASGKCGFICHCDTQQAASDDYAIRLGFLSKSFGLFAKINELSASLGELGAKIFGQPRFGSPLVFINACGSSKITPEGVTSFPDLFLEAGSSAVIGTEVAVPDPAAAEFARAFYTCFFKTKTLGEAMYEARANLLYQFNPSGAIYSAYADPGLRLSNPIELEPPLTGGR